MAHCYPDLAGDVDVVSDSEVYFSLIYETSHGDDRMVEMGTG